MTHVTWPAPLRDAAEAAPGLWPWEAEPYRLWSLADMRRLMGAQFYTSVRQMEHAKLLAANSDEQARERLRDGLTGLLENAKEIPLRYPFVHQIERLQSRIDEAPLDALYVMIEDTLDNLMAELTQYLFFVVQPERKWLYLKPEDWVGLPVAARFPGISRDLRDACQCLALAQWTAAVFHAMRLLERGPLRLLAERLSVVPTDATQLQNWHNVIDRIEAKIRDLQNQPNKQAADRDALTTLSEAAAQLRYFKDAWRNHVSHARKDYDEQEATVVLNAVKYFMVALAKQPATDRP